VFFLLGALRCFAETFDSSLSVVVLNYDKSPRIDEDGEGSLIFLQSSATAMDELLSLIERTSSRQCSNAFRIEWTAKGPGFVLDDISQTVRDLLFAVGRLLSGCHRICSLQSLPSAASTSADHKTKLPAPCLLPLVLGDPYMHVLRCHLLNRISALVLPNYAAAIEDVAAVVTRKFWSTETADLRLFEGVSDRQPASSPSFTTTDAVRKSFTFDLATAKPLLQELKCQIETITTSLKTTSTPSTTFRASTDATSAPTTYECLLKQLAILLGGSFYQTNQQSALNLELHAKDDEEASGGAIFNKLVLCVALHMLGDDEMAATTDVLTM
jgi:hypothetical protein